MIKKLEQFVELTDGELKEISGGLTGRNFITGPLTDHNK